MGEKILLKELFDNIVKNYECAFGPMPSELKVALGQEIIKAALEIIKEKE
jgi:hypothetical protein